MILDSLRMIFYLAIAIPFIYMFYDVSKTLFHGMQHILTLRTKPVLIHIVNSINKL
jgi:hypothetical protein